MERPTSADRLNIAFRRRQTKPGPTVSVQLIATRREDRAKMVDPNVINLSSRSLNKAEKNLLSKGLKFLITPTPNGNYP